MCLCRFNKTFIFINLSKNIKPSSIPSCFILKLMTS
nr:MAG TPA: hypothetical protein [Caudoviricetes sp.]